MKLLYGPASPYSRKVRVAAHELGVALELEAVNAMGPDPRLGSVNPVNRVPALVLDDGEVLFDSPVICEYLDVTFGPKLLPVSGLERWRVLRTQALGDGVMDSAVPRRQESMRPAEQQSADRLALYNRSISQILDHLEADLTPLAGFDLGTIAVACALSYLDFRFPDDDWGASRPRLKAWFDGALQRPSFQATLNA